VESASVADSPVCLSISGDSQYVPTRRHAPHHPLPLTIHIFCSLRRYPLLLQIGDTAVRFGSFKKLLEFSVGVFEGVLLWNMDSTALGRGLVQSLDRSGIRAAAASNGDESDDDADSSGDEWEGAKSEGGEGEDDNDDDDDWVKVPAVDNTHELYV
jgi:hypothetical protein